LNENKGAPAAESSNAGRRIAFVTCQPRQEGWEDDRLSAELLGARGIEVEFVAWDDPAVEWESFDLAVVRSTWDYTQRLEEFLAWTERVGPERLRNVPAMLRWNTDKRYLAELDGAGLPVPPTALVAPGGPAPPFGGKVVIKPVLGAGARDTGIFDEENEAEGLALLEKLGAQDEIAMIQPYIPWIEERGETAVIFFGGHFAYALKKKAFLPESGVAPARPGTTVAEGMFDEDLMSLAEATEAEIDLGSKAVAWLARRFGSVPLYARIDMVSSPAGEPVLMEVEVTEPSLYLELAAGRDPSGAELFAAAVEATLV
jgi:glutathione synthase/RimK-type ligase-like ATP-grasp enzyme